MKRLTVAALVLLAGCASLQREPAWQPARALAGPEEFSADYQWLSASGPEGFEQAPALLRILARRCGARRQVRAIGLSFFGATVFDFVLSAETGHPALTAAVRVGGQTRTQALAERLVRAAYFGQPTRPATRMHGRSPGGDQPAAEIEFKSQGADYCWRLQAWARTPLTAEDFYYSQDPPGKEAGN